MTSAPNGLAARSDFRGSHYPEVDVPDAMNLPNPVARSEYGRAADAPGQHALRLTATVCSSLLNPEDSG